MNRPALCLAVTGFLAIGLTAYAKEQSANCLRRKQHRRHNRQVLSPAGRGESGFLILS